METAGTEQILLLETIRVTDGAFHLLPLHRQRMMRSCRELYGCDAPVLDLTTDDIPPGLRRGTLKCRVTYATDIVSVEFERYTPRAVRSLRLVDAASVDYRLKYADRSVLERLRALRGEADEVVIVCDGLVTDTSYSNLVFRAGDRLLTPARPLLEGVMRRHLIDCGIVEEADITPSMLLTKSGSGLSEVFMINAMLPLGAIDAIPLARLS